MSHSNDSIPSTVTQVQNFEMDDFDEDLNTATLVLQDEVEIMIQRVSECIDCSKEVLGILLRLLRLMEKR